MSLTVICPTRSRRSWAEKTLQTFDDTKTLGSTRLLFAVNSDEEEMYKGLPSVIVPKQEWMNDVLNLAAWRVLNEPLDPPNALGFIGDDNRFITNGWDRDVMEVLRDNGGGFAHCNDLHRNDIPTHVFVTSAIVQSLGWFGLPALRHMFLDNVWSTLGRGANCIYYLPNTIIEHLHYTAGKSEYDHVYERSQSIFNHDSEIFTHWVNNRAEHDIQIVREALER